MVFFSAWKKVAAGLVLTAPLAIPTHCIAQQHFDGAKAFEYAFGSLWRLGRAGRPGRDM